MERPKVLIGDGSTFVRIMLRNMLEKLGFEVATVCKDGNEALAKYLETKPDMALIDLALGGMDGVTLTYAITRAEPSAYVILLVPEGSDDPEVIVEAVRAGIKGYIRKPLSAEGLEARLGRIVKREEEK